VSVNQPLQVVAAMIVQDERVLACRRAIHKSAAGMWEFPGGKVEPDEEPFVALFREIREELGIPIEVVETIDISETLVGDQIIQLQTVLCRMDQSEILSSTDHDEIIWVNAALARLLSWAKPDIPGLLKLIELGIIK